MWRRCSRCGASLRKARCSAVRRRCPSPRAAAHPALRPPVDADYRQPSTGMRFPPHLAPASHAIDSPPPPCALDPLPLPPGADCLVRSRSSQAKYLSRARARVSSFWSLTKQEPGRPVEHLCLIEVCLCRMRRRHDNARVAVVMRSLVVLRGGRSAHHPCHVLYCEQVWHMRYGNEIRQAEGPRPRTIPSAEAWYWLDVWCQREGVDLSSWDCYS